MFRKRISSCRFQSGIVQEKNGDKGKSNTQRIASFPGSLYVNTIKDRDICAVRTDTRAWSGLRHEHDQC
ncbi:hypothetical protein [Methanosarcina sp. Kolksee]|uniref:hypothetical protein n=1 Tax=Methanosarcina sp. Kolksee TaxID=1434099 RepID=UPI0012E0C1B4|nr:hypothetical protein [Methanosarcina sp. Kolksee]